MTQVDKVPSNIALESFSKKPVEGGVWEVAIVGSGPAALTAAIYTTRGAASTVLFAGESWGGQLMLTTRVDNFPGFPEGIDGPLLMDKMKTQASRFGTEIIGEKVASVDFSKRPFELISPKGTTRAKSLIIATGAETRWLGVPGEEKLRGRGVSSCAPCDAPFFKDKKVAVIGGGDSAMEEALVLTKYATNVIMVVRKEELKASAAMQERVKATGKIEFLWNSEVKEFIGEEKLEKMRIYNNKTGKESEIEIDGAFVAIGHMPATEVFEGKVDIDEVKHIKRYEKDGFKSATNIEGVFVAGDVHDSHYRQAITAAGFGCMAAMDALSFLDKPVSGW